MENRNVNEKITSTVTEKGLLIPKKYLDGIDRVEIVRKNNVLEIIPTKKNDPIFKLGSKPVDCGIEDGSEKHDKYIYG